MQADLVQYRDHHRLLVLFAPSKNDSRLIRQQNAFRHEAVGMKERQLLQIVVLPTTASPSGLDSNRLRRRYRVPAQAYKALLIGKDGTVAYETRSFVKPTALYARIDAMPMRRVEMRRGKIKTR